MGLLDRVLRRSHEVELDSISAPRGWLSRLDMTGSGVEVNDTTALNFLTFYASVALLSDCIGMMPVKAYRHTADGAQAVNDHASSPLLSIECNPETSAMVGRQVVQALACTGGCGYAEIERDKGGRPRALWPIHWRRIRPRRHANTQELVFDVLPYALSVSEEGIRQGCPEGGTVPEQGMLRIPGLSLAGLRAISPVAVAREVIGAGIAADRWLSAFFGNGAWPGGWIKTGKKFKDSSDREKFLESINARHQGAARAFRIGVLEDGADFLASTIKAEDAQLLGLRVDLRREVARLFRIPLHMVGDLERATFSNIEEQGLEFVTYTLLPWIVKWEQELARKMLTEEEKRTHYFKFNTGALLRGNLAARFAAYASGIQGGFMAPDEARELEDWNPIPGGKGKVWLFPLNAEQIGAGAKAPAKRFLPRSAMRAFAQFLPDEHDRARRACAFRAVRELDRGSGSPLERLLPAWEASGAEARRVLSGSLRVACRAVAAEMCPDDLEAELVGERAAKRLALEESGEIAGRMRAAAEAAYASTSGDSTAAIRAAISGDELMGAEEGKRLLQKVQLTVAAQIGWDDEITDTEE